MKKILLIALSSLLFLSVANELTVNDMNISHTEKMEQRISELNAMLKEKEKEREAKSLVRELKLKKLDNALKEKAKLREESDSEHNAEEINQVLEKAPVKVQTQTAQISKTNTTN